MKTKPRRIQLNENTVKIFYDCGRCFATKAAIGAKFGVQRVAVWAAMKKYPELKEAFERGQADADYALSQAFNKKIEEGNIAALIYMHKYRNRYTEKLEISGANGAPIVNKIEIVAMAGAAQQKKKSDEDETDESDGTVFNDEDE